MASSTRQQSIASTIDRPTPTLLYDAKCEICNRLAFQLREAADDLSLVALSDPEAERLLGQFYDDPDHDFYLIEGDTVRKGARALPKLRKLVGTRTLAGLVREYAEYKTQQGDCGGDHDHDHDGGLLSRRTFSSGMSATALSVASPLLDLTSPPEKKGKQIKPRPPKGLTARVARITPDGDGGFTASVTEDASLVRDRTFTKDKDPMVQSRKKQPAKMEPADSGKIETTGAHEINRATLDVQPEHPNGALRQAIETSGDSATTTGRMDRYGLIDDRDRFGLSLNFGRGPMVIDGESAVEETLSGKIHHDVPAKTVDFLQLETDYEADLAEHVDAYVVGLRAFSDHYAASNETKLAELYGSLADRLAAVGPEFTAAVDGETTPVTNTLGISSVPHWTRYVESPSATAETSTQSVTTEGVNCECGCCGLSCCSDCGCGCSICLGSEIGCSCGCCIIGCGGGCGCGCCVCA
jgi:hypothetical protein